MLRHWISRFLPIILSQSSRAYEGGKLKVLSTKNKFLNPASANREIESATISGDLFRKIRPSMVAVEQKLHSIGQPLRVWKGSQIFWFLNSVGNENRQLGSGNTESSSLLRTSVLFSREDSAKTRFGTPARPSFRESAFNSFTKASSPSPFIPMSAPR